MGRSFMPTERFWPRFLPTLRPCFFRISKSENQIDVKCDYVGLREILRVIHHVGREFSAKGRRYKPEMLENIYSVADMLDFPDIRSLCEDEMLRHASVKMANVAHSLGLHDIMIRILTKLNPSQAGDFISESNTTNLGTRLIFSKADVLFVYKKTKGQDPTSSGDLRAKTLRHKLKIESHPEGESPLNLEEISEELANPRIDLTKKWPVSNVTLATNNFMGRFLHSSKAVLASVSPYFYKLFYENDGAKKEGDKSTNAEDGSLYTVDAEYATMKLTLSIIHHCSTDFGHNASPLFHNVLLYDMYLTASVDKLDIPMIRDFCCDKLREQGHMKNTFDVVVKLGIADLTSYLVNTVDWITLRHWVLLGNKTLSYLQNGTEVIITTDSQEQVLSADDLRILLQRM